MSLVIEIHIKEHPKSNNAASYFKFDPEEHRQMLKELRELLISVDAEDNK